jgi:L-asparagine transporter-like permease
MQDAKDFVLSELEGGGEQIVIPKTVFYTMWNVSRRLTVYNYRFLCYCCVDLLNAMHTAHDEHHFQLFFIFCELPGVPLLLLRDNINMSTATAFLYFNEVFAIPNLSKQLQ